MRSPKQDRVKYAGIGGIVLATGLLAMASGGFAFTTAFGPKGMAGTDLVSSIGFKVVTVAFAIFWGLMIFNLDRFIVSSTGKGDGTDSITWKEFGQAIPRIIIALILGLTISKPLEIKILETEINVELRKKQQEKLAEFNESTTKRFQADIDRIDADLAKIETDRSALVERQKAAEQEYIDQAIIDQHQMKIANQGNNYSKPILAPQSVNIYQYNGQPNQMNLKVDSTDLKLHHLG
jgi:hypothetical protein